MCRDIFVCVWNYRNSYHGTVSFLPHSGFIMLCDVSLSLICLTAHRVQCWFTLFSGACRSSRLPITFSSGIMLWCSTRVCACTSPAFDVDAAAACCSTSPDVFSFSGILLPTPCLSVTAISSVPWRFFAGPWTMAWRSDAGDAPGIWSSSG